MNFIIKRFNQNIAIKILYTVISILLIYDSFMFIINSRPSHIIYPVFPDIPLLSYKREIAFQCAVRSIFI